VEIIAPHLEPGAAIEPAPRRFIVSFACDESAI